MSMLRKEWTEEEIQRLEYDLKAAKSKVLADWGFTVEEISRIAELPDSIIRHMLEE